LRLLEGLVVADETARRAFLSAIKAARWDDELPRLVYADWLDEHGEHEEADRQRRCVPAERWLREFAGRIIDSETFESMSYEALIGAATTFLNSGIGHDMYLDKLDEVNAQKADFWKNFEIVTGIAVPDRARELMFFGCTC
jgi:uncharacterized protein (TIGR02996 family)